MKITKIAEIKSGQDGAIFNNFLFRFDSTGNCTVYDVKNICFADEAKKLEPAGEFTLDKIDLIVPHSNAVMFGSEYYSKEDEFPLLYTNIYNNYAKHEDRMVGVCPAYRITRKDGVFSSKLVMIIKIGFTDDCNLWKSEPDTPDIRPYGNFTIDRKKGVYYAFTMRDKTHTTRYFSFDLPKVSDGIYDSEYDAKVVVLNKEDIKEYFDCEYHRFVQGACFDSGKIYSVEGFTGDKVNIPALRVIDVISKKQVMYVDLVGEGLEVEPEMIEFSDGICYYSDGHGNLYTFDFS